MSLNENSFDSFGAHYIRPPVPSYLNRVKALNLSSVSQTGPQKVLSTVIFNETPDESEKGSLQVPPLSNQTRSKTPIKSRKVQTNLPTKRKEKVTQKKRSSSVKTEFNVHAVPKLNEEVKKILKIVCDHSRVCQDIHYKILKEGGSKLLRFYLKSITS